MITEGQIVLSRDLYRRGADPPVDALPCLSRLMNLGIGPGKTREDHRGVADQESAGFELQHGRGKVLFRQLGSQGGGDRLGVFDLRPGRLDRRAGVENVIWA